MKRLLKKIAGFGGGGYHRRISRAGYRVHQVRSLRTHTHGEPLQLTQTTVPYGLVCCFEAFFWSGSGGPSREEPLRSHCRLITFPLGFFDRRETKPQWNEMAIATLHRKNHTYDCKIFWPREVLGHSCEWLRPGA